MGHASQIEHGTLNGAGGIGGLLARTTFGQELPGAPTTSFYHADGKGNITGLIYPLGAVVATYQYDPFGNLISANGSLAAFNKYRFSSKRWDANADLYYYGYRFYDPNLQRWLNRHPIQEWGGWNLYGFVGNSPLDLIDPFGLCGGGGGTMTADGLGGIGESTAGRAIAAAPAVAAEGALGAAAFSSMLFAAVTGADNWYETNPNGVNAPPESVESPLPFNRSNLPIRGGPPNGSLSGDYGNGAGQIRDYDPNGNAETDYDFGHDHTGAGDPHAHDWDWTNPNSPDRSAPRPLCPGE